MFCYAASYVYKSLEIFSQMTYADFFSYSMAWQPAQIRSSTSDCHCNKPNLF